MRVRLLFFDVRLVQRRGTAEVASRFQQLCLERTGSRAANGKLAPAPRCYDLSGEAFERRRASRRQERTSELAQQEEAAAQA